MRGWDFAFFHEMRRTIACTDISTKFKELLVLTFPVFGVATDSVHAMCLFGLTK
jgi:hypothetical protein